MSSILIYLSVYLSIGVLVTHFYMIKGYSLTTTVYLIELLKFLLSVLLFPINIVLTWLVTSRGWDD
jgi:hypothetical protein